MYCLVIFTWRSLACRNLLIQRWVTCSLTFGLMPMILGLSGTGLSGSVIILGFPLTTTTHPAMSRARTRLIAWISRHTTSFVLWTLPDVLSTNEVVCRLIHAINLVRALDIAGCVTGG